MSRSQSHLNFVDLRQTRPPQPPDAEDLLRRGATQLSIQQSEEVKTTPKKVRVKRSEGSYQNQNQQSLEKNQQSGPPSESANNSDGMFFSDFSEQAQIRIRAMLINFCHITDLRFFRKIDLQQFGIDSGQIVNNATVQELCSLMEDKIEELVLTNCVDVSDVGCWAIAKHAPSIKVLYLGNCNQITNIGLRSLSLRCHHLIKLDFTGCHLLDDMALSTLAGGTWNIEELVLTDCTGITDSGLSKFARSASKLRKLDLRGCINVGDYGDKSFKDIGAFCANLEVLNVSGCKHVSDNGLRAIAVGCPKISRLAISGCSEITGISIKAIAKHLSSLESITLNGCMRLTNKDMNSFQRASCRGRLSSVDITGCAMVSDPGIACICRTFGTELRAINFSKSAATDLAVSDIAMYCKDLRSLDLSWCSAVTDKSVHIAAQQITALTTLVLTGNKDVTAKTLMSYVGSKLEFAEMASQWVGYKPKEGVEQLIAGRENFRRRLAAVVVLQCLFRRKKAFIIYIEKRRWWLLNIVIPRVQALFRGYQQRKRYQLINKRLLRERCAIKIQSQYRAYLMRLLRERKLKELAFMRLKQMCALKIQKLYWGMLGRRRVVRIRDEIATGKLRGVQRRALEEQRTTIIQKNFRAWCARNIVERMEEKRRRILERKALEERSIRVIQRIVRGRAGRKKALRRRADIATFAYRVVCARNIERVFRGFQGRKRAEAVRRQKWLDMRNHMASKIQRIFRGMRGRLFAAIARALKKLRFEHNLAATEMQRFIRGCLGRMHVALVKEKLRRQRLENISVITIQRVFRGHKGKEALELEREVHRMELLAKPLFQELKTLESNGMQCEKLLNRMESAFEIMEKEIKELEIELVLCLETSAKYTDCDKINGMPQRFLTKYLRIRLKDHYDHQKEVFDRRRDELGAKRIEMRDLERKITACRRELVPLTTGLVVATKRNRTKRLRELVRAKKSSAIKIQALWRRAIVRVAYTDPMRPYWIECQDEEQGEGKYYYNTWTRVTAWKVPFAFVYFGHAVHYEDLHH